MASPSRGLAATDNKTIYRPGGGETICLPSMAVRLAADLRPSADGSNRSPHISGGYSLHPRSLINGISYGLV